MGDGCGRRGRDICLNVCICIHTEAELVGDCIVDRFERGARPKRQRQGHAPAARVAAGRSPCAAAPRLGLCYNVLKGPSIPGCVLCKGVAQLRRHRLRGASKASEDRVTRSLSMQGNRGRLRAAAPAPTCLFMPSDPHPPRPEVLTIDDEGPEAPAEVRDARRRRR